MEIHKLVKIRGLDSKKVKLVRHQELKYDINMLYKKGFINDYQSVQSKDVFKGCQYILSFLGVEATKAIYIGAYKKNSTIRTEVNTLPEYFFSVSYVWDDICRKVHTQYR